jgi:uncharacterized protein (DUF885 family)
MLLMTPSQLHAQIFKEVLSIYPSFGSFLGLREYDTKLENPFNPAFERRLDQLRRKYQRMCNSLPRDDVDSMLLQRKLANMRLLRSLPQRLLPLWPYQNVLIEFPYVQQTLYQTNYDTNESVNMLLKRCKCMYDSMGDMIDCMREGIQKKITIPQMACKLMIQSLEHFVKTDAYIVKVKVNPVPSEYLEFMKGPYKNKLADIIRFLKTEYLPACNTAIGMCALPKGREWYSKIIAANITERMTPQEIHAYGKQEVARIEKCMSDLQKQMRIKGSLDEFKRHMKTTPSMFFTSASDVMKAFNRARTLIRKHLLPSLFHTMPSETYTLSETPSEIAGSAAGAFYYAPSLTGRKGAVSISLNKPVRFAKYDVGPLSLHEGEPGHHMQFQYMLDQKLPMHRIFGWSGCTFAEGWALYIEKYLDTLVEKGIMDQHQLFGRYSYDMMRAVRLVVDTGIHYYGWSYNKVLKYMKRHIPMSTGTIKSELLRYICDPTQALCYKVGEYEFNSMYTEYVEKQGMDVRDFHHTVLKNGLMPMSVLWKVLEQEARGR